MAQYFSRSSSDRASADLRRRPFRRLAQRYQTVIPVPIDIFAAEWNIPVADAADSAEFEAMSVFDEGYQVVFINRHRPVTAQRFALAHEIVGHGWHHKGHLRGIKSTLDWSTYFIYRYLEIEANTAAAEFLLPFDWLMESVQHHWGGPSQQAGTLLDWSRTPAFSDLARQADVGFVMLGYHLVDIGIVPMEDALTWTIQHRSRIQRQQG